MQGECRGARGGTAVGRRPNTGTRPQDSPYRGRPLAHMVLTFGQPIRGPIVLGAGRFRGLGLFLALDDERP
jgi:CRISPR-associated protein Csb2